MTDKDLGAAAGDIFAKAFTLGYETGRLIPPGGMALTAEQASWVQTLSQADPWWDEEHLTEVQAHVRALFPATEPAAVRDGSDLVVVQRSHTAKAVQSWMTLDLWTDLGKNDKDFDAEYERQGFGDLWATLLGEVRALVQATTPAPVEPAEEETKDEERRSIIHSNRTIKTVGEALSYAETALLNTYPDSAQRAHYAEVIAELLRDVARQRQVGSNGKHGELHTPTCGCEDVPTSSPVVPAPTETGPWQTLAEIPASVTCIKDRGHWIWTRIDADEWRCGALTQPSCLAPFVAAEERSA